MQGQWVLYHLKCDDLPAEYEESQGDLQPQNNIARIKTLAINPSNYIENKTITEEA